MSKTVVFDEFIMIFSKGLHPSFVNNLVSLKDGFVKAVLFRSHLLTHVLAEGRSHEVLHQPGASSHFPSPLHRHDSLGAAPPAALECLKTSQGTKETRINRIYNVV